MRNSSARASPWWARTRATHKEVGDWRRAPDQGSPPPRSTGVVPETGYGERPVSLLPRARRVHEGQLCSLNQKRRRTK
jgi:hypothetical protein